MDLIAKRSRTTKQLSLALFPDLESSSISADAVASNEDLLTEILLHLPIRSLVYFKSVSKHWLSLITNPRFSLLRSRLPLTASALFLRVSSYRRKPKYEFVSLDNDNCNSAPFKTLNFVHDPLGIRIIQSCNGLLLCSSFRGLKSEHKVYIYNPTTKQFTILPQLSGVGVSRGVCGMSLAFDPSKSPHYKVVCVIQISRDHFQIEIYSSESGPWRVSGQPFYAHFDTNFRSGVYWNGSVHWINHWGGKSYSLYFNVDDERLEKMPMHPIIDGDSDEIGDLALMKDWYFGESDDHLHLIEVYGYMAVLDVYEMKRDYSGWFVKYKVNLSVISNVFPEMITCRHDLTGENDYAVAVKTLVGREKEDGDASFLVLEIPGKVIRYNLVSNSFEKLCEFAPADTKFSGDLLRFGKCSEGFQYIESLACV